MVKQYYKILKKKKKQKKKKKKKHTKINFKKLYGIAVKNVYGINKNIILFSIIKTLDKTMVMLSFLD